MDLEKLKSDIGDDLCDFCPWKKGEVSHRCDSVCEGSYCDEALNNFLEDNEEFFDETDN